MRPILCISTCLLLVVCLQSSASCLADDSPESAPAPAASIWENASTLTDSLTWNGVNVAIAASSGAVCNGPLCSAPEFASKVRICAKTAADGARYYVSQCNPGERAIRPLARLARRVRR